MDHATVVRLTFVVFSMLTPFIAGSDVSSPLVLSPTCTDKCGNVNIPYPFGIEEGCYYKDQDIDDSSFNYYKVVCNDTFDPPVPFFDTSALGIVNITVETSEIRFKHDISFSCYSEGQLTLNFTNWIRAGRFTLSSSKNIFVAIGCDTYAWFTGSRFDSSRPYSIGCMTKCDDLEDTVDGNCNGVGCCQLFIPEAANDLVIEASSFGNHSEVESFNPCSMGFAVEKDEFRFYKNNLSLRAYRPQEDQGFEFRWVPIVVDWSIGTESCSAAQGSGSCLCKKNTVCYEPKNQTGYVCKCGDGYFGNPYHPQGCTDVDECKRDNDCEKSEYCVNNIGGYHCQCPKGYRGEGTKTDKCVSNTNAWLKPVIITAGGGGGIIVLLGIAFILHLKHGKRQLRTMRENFFKQNGGLLLHQKLSGRSMDALKVFTAQDLEIATNNYSDKFIVGRGGFGVVYKGILPNNQHIAIKRSLKVDPSQVEQFINEVIVLSQINNKNVVKLIGCCLETEVPLLVYEYITNGTLYDHLDDAVKASILTWSMRLRIASEIADVLSYLHSTILIPIIHRDIKSMNILLDQNYTAKVADFGASRLVPEDQGQLATMVLGTRGYLDPEYMQTSELTEKSDVYSYGVVLLELLTRKKAIANDRPEIERCLAMHFLVTMKEGRLLNILDKNIVREETIEQIQPVANLAKWCLMLKGEDRPTMKEVAVELENIKKKGSHPWNYNDRPPEDDESLLGGFQRTDTGGCSSGVESDLYDPRLVSTLEIGGR
ncbi:wall-associated receptor kinase 1 [Beta vulgaris subsp. vulgaris]|uniref:wall-associated receptor kinase 1 n=1 Tax=Beta vulgaris subsp. vulgaris TaxID=3555 RepID=UPI00203702E8|nr:wall-associated receptor kinase 1 [Beta vulgaris subsp. vulgaris]